MTDSIPSISFASIAILARKIPHWRFLRMSMVALSAYAGGTIQAHGSTLFDVSTRVIAWEKWQQRVLGLAALSIRGSSWPEKMPKPDRWQLFVLLHAKPSWVQGGECAHVPHILCMLFLQLFHTTHRRKDCQRQCSMATGRCTGVEDASQLNS